MHIFPLQCVGNEMGEKMVLMHFWCSNTYTSTLILSCGQVQPKPTAFVSLQWHILKLVTSARISHTLFQCAPSTRSARRMFCPSKTFLQTNGCILDTLPLALSCRQHDVASTPCFLPAHCCHSVLGVLLCFVPSSEQFFRDSWSPASGAQLSGGGDVAPGAFYNRIP